MACDPPDIEELRARVLSLSASAASRPLIGEASRVAQRRHTRRGDAGRSRSTPARAVAYVRTSTKHQQYSIENQSDATRRYAGQRRIKIARTCAD
ncbi:hypothetical protein DOO78_19560 [Roseicella frigidaeris]|uniref:Resolvase/invertase-type recombinase catalytic domain-containing protein n=2 Tax=Roseicella frigidaeris TaxID=2230885 RepID=A0A327M219_9PROT|nr:recombinase family protein [Roseicella frigidaeris]RAI57311.1 hypothetical protein DOO78_19560 [Roseicella frigidaeris]